MYANVALLFKGNDCASTVAAVMWTEVLFSDKSVSVPVIKSPEGGRSVYVCTVKAVRLVETGILQNLRVSYRPVTNI